MTVPGWEPEPSLPSQPPELVTKGSPSVLLSSHFFSPGCPLALCACSVLFPFSGFPHFPCLLPTLTSPGVLQVQKSGSYLPPGSPGNSATYFFQRGFQ